MEEKKEKKSYCIQTMPRKRGTCGFNDNNIRHLAANVCMYVYLIFGGGTLYNNGMDRHEKNNIRKHSP